MKGNTKNIGVLILLMLAGIVLGGFLADLLQKIPGLGILSYGKTFGMTTPLMLDLGILTLQFGCNIRFTLAGILGIVAAILIYRKM